MNTPKRQPDARPRRPRRATLLRMLAGGLAALAAAAPLAAQPAASLLPPRPAPQPNPDWSTPRSVMRAQSAEAEVPAPSVRGASPERAAGDVPAGGTRTYPPTYSGSKRTGLIDFGGSWRKSSANKTSTVEPPPAQAMPAGPPAPAAAPRQPMSGTFGGVAPLPSHLPPQNLTDPPAWRWYGYGTITPGHNAYAPTGRYPEVAGTWLRESGATPGAVPQSASNNPRPAPVELPTLPAPMGIPVQRPQPDAGPAKPEPVSSGPLLTVPPASAKVETAAKPTPAPTPGLKPIKAESVEPPLPPPLPPTGKPLPPGPHSPYPHLILPAVDSAPKATFEGGVRPHSAPAGKSVSARTTMPSSRWIHPGAMQIARGQAPTAAAPARNRPAPPALVEQVREAAGDAARGLTVHVSDDGGVAIRFTVPRQPDAEPAVNRVAKLPELARRRVDFEVSVR